MPRIPSALRPCVGTRGASASDRLLHQSGITPDRVELCDKARGHPAQARAARGCLRRMQVPHANAKRDSFVLWRVGGYHGTKAFGPTTAKSTWRWTRAKRHPFPSRGSSAAPTGRRRAKCKSGATMRRSEEFPCHRRCIAQSPNLSRSQTRRHRSSNSHCVKKSGATISMCNAGGWAKQHL